MSSKELHSRDQFQVVFTLYIFIYSWDNSGLFSLDDWKMWVWSKTNENEQIKKRDFGDRHIYYKLMERIYFIQIFVIW